ncbi:hypothetical protein D3C87_1643120 [compost metagenome]
MAFLIGQQLFEQLHGDVVSGLMTDVAGFLVRRAGVVFAGKIGLQHFLDVLADAQRTDGLQVRMTFKEDDARDELVGVVHFFDRLGAFLLGKERVAPIFEKTEMQPVLVDGTEFEIERFVKLLDDFFVAFQDPPSGCRRGIV